MLMNSRFWKSLIISYLWLENFTCSECPIFPFLFRTRFSWDEENDTCLNVECVLLGRNFDFVGGYFVVAAHYIMVTIGYFSLPGGYCSLPVGFFFLSGFSSQTLTIHRTVSEGRGPSFISLYHFHPLTNIETFICNFVCEMTITYF